MKVPVVNSLPAVQAKKEKKIVTEWSEKCTKSQHDRKSNNQEGINTNEVTEYIST